MVYHIDDLPQHHSDIIGKGVTIPGVEAKVSEGVCEKGADLSGVFSLQAGGTLHVVHHQAYSITEYAVVLLRGKEMLRC